jgi:hypothetical protein
MVGSNSQYLYGSDQLIALQNGYHADKSYLIPMQHLFFWRYYAGIWFAAFVYLLARFTKKVFSTTSFDYLALTIFTLMTLVSSPTHIFIKARPYLSTPLLTYRVVLGVLGVALLVSYLTMLVWKNLKNRRMAVMIVILIWGVILSGALTRPPYLEFYTQQVGIAYFAAGPNPLNTLSMLFGQLWLRVVHLLRF